MTAPERWQQRDRVGPSRTGLPTISPHLRLSAGTSFGAARCNCINQDNDPMTDPDPKPEQDETADVQPSQNPHDLEEAQEKAAEEREDEGGYQ
jgi:hypothetical protein